MIFPENRFTLFRIMRAPGFEPATGGFPTGAAERWCLV
jgi:hypothetical protein